MSGAARKGHGGVNVTRLPSGRYRWRVWVKLREEGKRLSGTEDTEKQALAAGQRARVDAERGKAALPSSVTVGEYVSQWITQKDGISDKSRALHSAHFRRDIEPRLGSRKLKALTPDLLRGFMTDLRDTRGLSYNSRRQIFNLLSAALSQAAEDGLLPSNPAAARGVRPAPDRKTSEELAAYTDKEAAEYLAACLDGRNRPAEVLALLLLTGLRKGEALFLRWDAVSLEAEPPFLEVRGTRSQSGGKVYENASGKTDRARRRVPLSDEAAELLRRVRQRKAEEAEMLGTPGSEYVFSGMRSGSAYRPDNLDRVHTAVCQRAEVRRLPIHALRHTYASLAASQGMRVEVLSKLLGHADPAFTLRQYRHLYPEELAGVSLRLPAPVYGTEPE